MAYPYHRLHLNRNNNKIFAITVASIAFVLLTPCGVWGRPGSSALFDSERHHAEQLQLERQQEEMFRAHKDARYNEFRKLHNHRQPNYPSKWPALSDLYLAAADYEENLLDSGSEESAATAADNSRLIEHLLALESIDADRNYAEGIGKGIDEVRNGNAKNHRGKEQGTKKTVQYMSPCHFKICNMGRKRNVRNFRGFN